MSPWGPPRGRENWVRGCLPDAAFSLAREAVAQSGAGALRRVAHCCYEHAGQILLVPPPDQDSRIDLDPLEWAHLAGPLRPGERLTATIGSCAACATLVVRVAAWHPTDGHGENAVQYQTRWTPLFAPHDQDNPAPADPAARAPLPATTVGLDGQDLTPRGQPPQTR